MLASVLLLYPCVQGQSGDALKVLPKDSSYTREVLPGQIATATWIVYNADNISSYSGRVIIVGETGNWNISLKPETFTIAPDTVQEVNLKFLPTNANLGESRNIDVRFNFTEITAGAVPFTVSADESVTFTIIAKPVTEKHGITVWGNTVGLPRELDNDVGRFVIAVCLWSIFALCALGFLFIFKKVTEKTKSRYDDIFIGIVRTPSMMLIFLYGLVDSLSELSLSPVSVAWLYKIYYFFLIVIVAYLGFKLFKGIIISWLKDVAKKTSTDIDDILVPIFEKLGVVIIVVITAIFLLSYLGVDVTVFVAGMGVAGLVVAFAAQDTLSNFFAGLHLLLDRPFVVGDTIILENGDYCEVLRIGLRSTRLYNTFSDDEISTPNNKIANTQITNVSKPDRKEKGSVEVGVDYGSDIDLVEKILHEIALAHPNVVTEGKYKPVVRLQTFADNSVHFKIIFTADDFNNRWRAAHEMRKEIFKRFRKEGISLPFPQRVVHLKKEN